MTVRAWTTTREDWYGCAAALDAPRWRTSTHRRRPPLRSSYTASSTPTTPPDHHITSCSSMKVRQPAAFHRRWKGGGAAASVPLTLKEEEEGQRFSNLRFTSFTAYKTRRISRRKRQPTLYWIEQGLTSHQTHYRSYRRRAFMGQMTQPTVSKHWRKIGPKD